MAGASSAPEGSGWIVYELLVGLKSTVPVEESLNRRGIMLGESWV
jgi:hypothetical protein